MPFHTLTTEHCHRAALRALAAHRSTRPATPAEAAAIAAGLRAQAASLRATAAALRNQRSKTAAEIGRGPYAVAERHESSRDVCRASHEAGRIEQLAAGQTMRAEAWERIADQPDLAWLVTEAELLGRVQMYAQDSRDEGGGA